MSRRRRIQSAALIAAGAGLGLSRMLSRQRPLGDNPVVVITGGSRGLGLALAMEYAKRGAKLALCSRDLLELRIAEKKLLPYHSEILIHECDLKDRERIRLFIEAVMNRFGRIDILVNNAGIMEVAPLDVLREDEFREVVEVNLWGMIEMSFEALPHMGLNSRIVNITSIGGEVAVPHLLPYTVSKFGAVGFSLGLDAELSRRGISVTTVVPGLMRTGSFVNALFKGDSDKEFRWFALGGALPFTSISAESAAQKIVSASLRRQRFLVLSPQARLLRLIYHLAPGLSLAMMRTINRFLPSPKGSSEDQAEPGRLHRDQVPVLKKVLKRSHEVGDRLNENMVS